MNTIYVDGSCKGNEQPNIKKRRMYTCVVVEELALAKKSIRFLGANDGSDVAIVLIPGGSNNIAELIAIESGLKIAIGLSYQEVLIKSDSSTALAWVKADEIKSHKINDPELTKKIHNLIKDKWIPMIQKVEFELVPREKNLAGIKLDELSKTNLLV